jgi:metal-dependent amidase/aminoacylase/carboxypeptidase family protein
VRYRQKYIFSSNDKMGSSSNSIQAIIESNRPQPQTYESLYKSLHANPELSHQESETAALVTKHLTSLSKDFEIRQNIGGTGLIAILKNGGGETVLLRADMDALPVKEMTGLEYASQKQATDIHGDLQHVMHGRSPTLCLYGTLS